MRGASLALRRESALAPHIALILVQLMFGTFSIAGKIALRSLPPTGIVAFRTGGAALAFIFLQRMLGRVRIKEKRDYAWLALYSLLGVTLNQLFSVKGLSLTSAINANLLGTTIPVFTLLISILLGYERLSWRRVLGILLAALGVLYLIDPLRASFSGGTTHGNILLVLNSLCYASYLAISKDLLKRYGALTVITWVFIFGSLMTVPIGAYTLSQVPLRQLGIVAWLAVLYIVLLPTFGAYYLNAWALARVAPSTAAVYIYLQPLVAFVLAPLIVNERWNSRTWVAAALICAGVAVVTLRGRSHAMEEVPERPEALGH